MKTAFLLLGLLAGGDSNVGLITVAKPVSETETSISIGQAFDEPLAADIQMIEPAMVAGEACGTCCQGGSCGSCGHGRLKYDLCNPPTDMVPHTPYFQNPKTYYYFRPYNYAHILPMQSQATGWGVAPGNPYSNKIFEDVYEQIEEEIKGQLED